MIGTAHEPHDQPTAWPTLHSKEPSRKGQSLCGAVLQQKTIDSVLTMMAAALLALLDLALLPSQKQLQTLHLDTRRHCMKHSLNGLVWTIRTLRAPESHRYLTCLIRCDLRANMQFQRPTAAVPLYKQEADLPSDVIGLA